MKEKYKLSSEKRKKMSKKKKKIQTDIDNILDIVVIIFFIIFFTLFTIKSFDKKEIIIGDIKLVETVNGSYAKFGINNPTSREKTCLVEIESSGKLIKRYINLDPQTKKSYKISIKNIKEKADPKIEIKCF